MADSDEPSLGTSTHALPPSTLQPPAQSPTSSPSRSQASGQEINIASGPSHSRLPSSEDHRRRPTSPDEALSSQRPSPSLSLSSPRLDLTTYPTPTLLHLLANLLQQIATANDQLRPDADEDGEDRTQDDTSPGSRTGSRQSSHPHPSPTTALFSKDNQTPVPPIEWSDLEHPLFTASLASLARPSSLLSFHARHVPSISIEAYLLRILKYCPTTNEVFLGLLVYFDRMSRLGTAQGVSGIATGIGGAFSRGFAIDSFNVHRLIIAGVTVASKFFSGKCRRFQPFDELRVA